MKLPSLNIANLKASFPLIQGGMSVRVSTSALAIPVANCGGIGVIGGSGIPPEELHEDIIKAKSATDGIIAVNIMYAMKDFYNLVMSSIDAGVDMIITGAGFSRDIFKIGKEHNTPIVMIVSSPTLAKLAEKLGASAVIVEAKEAGGHLGTDKPLREIFPLIRKVIKKIPLIAAGGITNGYEMAELMDTYGADGVQIASRFVLSEECDVADEYKQAFLNARQQDIVITTSPVGLPGRAINTDFVRKMNAGEDMSTKKCPHLCLKKCDHHYCINERLMLAKDGNVNEGLVFSGENTFKMNKILPVAEIFRRFKKQAESVYKEGIGFNPLSS
ncbi:NAD(P)H-dependent flavin oxidoreductase [Desulforhopalus singaporensis]|uniref:NAD(P)H-dependent flavin oxidoreductase YrpB, nitropropane dioxygenase family n=1 Tax=Desulforhopalus singaporensis TaxID=91360 RepID=A0A1H0V3F0_9BACT|nr:nitronate monooxygenase [Desulforhopalus singaporensis]SDP72894.1 NAD(P)H-dependent flavin oxidoreductase YrpB, nitropropane dioxygenase family [Desulforhopalus singaporensis]